MRDDFRKDFLDAFVDMCTGGAVVEHSCENLVGHDVLVD